MSSNHRKHVNFKDEKLIKPYEKGKKKKKAAKRKPRKTGIINSTGLIKTRGAVQQVIINPQQAGRAQQKRPGPHVPTNKKPSFVIYNTPGPTQRPLVPPSTAYPTNQARPVTLDEAARLAGVARASGKADAIAEANAAVAGGLLGGGVKIPVGAPGSSIYGVPSSIASSIASSDSFPYYPRAPSVGSMGSSAQYPFGREGVSTSGRAVPPGQQATYRKNTRAVPDPEIGIPFVPEKKQGRFSKFASKIGGLLQSSDQQRMKRQGRAEGKAEGKEELVRSVLSTPAAATRTRGGLQDVFALETGGKLSASEAIDRIAQRGSTGVGRSRVRITPLDAPVGKVVKGGGMGETEQDRIRRLFEGQEDVLSRRPDKREESKQEEAGDDAANDAAIGAEQFARRRALFEPSISDL